MTSAVPTERRFDPMDIVIEPGVTVGSLKDRADLRAAVGILEFQIAEIKAQLSDSPPIPRTDQDWRRRAESALRIKKHALQIVRTKLSLLNAHGREEHFEAIRNRPLHDVVQQLKAMIEAFRDELGDDEAQRIIDGCKARHPELFGGAEA